MTKTNSWCLRIVTLAVRPSMTVFSSFANEESFSRDQCGADWLCFKFCSCFGVGQCQPQQGWVPSPPGWALQLPVALCSLTLEHNPLQQAWELIGVHPDNCLLFSGTYLKDSSLWKFTALGYCKHLGSQNLKHQVGMGSDIRSYFSKSGCVFQPTGVGRRTTTAFSFHAGSDVNLWGWRALDEIKLKLTCISHLSSYDSRLQLSDIKRFWTPPRDAFLLTSSKDQNGRADKNVLRFVQRCFSPIFSWIHLWVIFL